MGASFALIDRNAAQKQNLIFVLCSALLFSFLLSLSIHGGQSFRALAELRFQKRQFRSLWMLKDQHSGNEDFRMSEAETTFSQFPTFRSRPAQLASKALQTDAHGFLWLCLF